MKFKIGMSALALLPLVGGASMAAGQTGIVNYEFVNIRINPSINESVKFIVKKGDKVEILSEKDGWYNIKTVNGNGWIQKNAVKLDSKSISNNIKTSSKADSTMKKVVVSNKLNMRKSSDITSERIYTLNRGEYVNFISAKNGWAKISVNGKTGYVSSYYLSDTEQSIVEDVIEDTNNEISQEFETDSFAAIQNDTNSLNKGSSFVKSTGSVNYKNLHISLSDHVNMQLAKSLNLDSNSGWSKVDYNQLYKYMNPENYTDYAGMMQFVVLNKYTDDITAAELNSYLNKYVKPGNVFYNQGQAFINAARKNNINVLYLVAHSMIETGYGTSKLAKGVQYNGKTVYNFFGIGAVDGNALAGGSATAYKNGWTSVAAGIDGASAWIASKYIHNSTYGQNTLYEMKWSTNYTWHQYASDVSWPSKIGSKMNEIKQYSSVQNSLDYLVPKYK